MHQITKTLIKSGVPTAQIGIPSLYRQQIKTRVFTADKSQRRDEECINYFHGTLERYKLAKDSICSKPSDEAKSSWQVGELTKDWHRLNVSFIRLRSKLIIVGSRNTLQDTPLLTEFFSLMENQDWIFHLPPGADSLHADVFLPKLYSFQRGANDENMDSMDRQSKKMKTRKIVGEDGLLRGRPLLQDLLNEAK